MARSTFKDTRCSGSWWLNTACILLSDPFVNLAELENEEVELQLDIQDKQSELATLNAQAQQIHSGDSSVCTGVISCLRLEQ